MNNTLYLAFDTEFTELSPRGELISIGIKAFTIINNRPRNVGQFYAEITGVKSNDDWIKKNVFANLKFNDCETKEIYGKDYLYVKNIYEKCHKYLVGWVNTVSADYDSVLFISDVAHYDMTHLVDLITNKGVALDVSKFIDKIDTAVCCYDINQCIYDGSNNDMDTCFDISRDTLASKVKRHLAIADDYWNMSAEQHNALHDAIAISLIFIGNNLMD